MPDLEKLHEAVIEGDWKAAASLTHAALATGAAPLTIVSQYLVPAMDEVGRRFECEEYFVPEMLLSARAMKASMEIVRPLLAAGTDFRRRAISERALSSTRSGRSLGCATALG